MGFRFVPKSVNMSDLERRNGRYCALFYRFRRLWGQLAYVKVNEDIPILSATQIESKECNFSNI